MDDNPQLEFRPRVLATDLDGTLIPLPDNAANRDDLRTLEAALERAGAEIVFATGRHFESVERAAREHGLPRPHWIVCDVGTSIHRRRGDTFEPFAAYHDHLAERASGTGREAVETVLRNLEGLDFQGPEDQKDFKVSFTCEADRLEELLDAVDTVCAGHALPWRALGSLDPFSGLGLIDVLPAGVTKAHALDWLATHADYGAHEVVYAGDSGNDFAALVSGARAILVANASPDLRRRVAGALAEKGWSDRLHVARAPATSGVLEGCRHFGLVD